MRWEWVVQANSRVEATILLPSSCSAVLVIVGVVPAEVWVRRGADASIHHVV